MRPAVVVQAGLCQKDVSHDGDRHTTLGSFTATQVLTPKATKRVGDNIDAAVSFRPARIEVDGAPALRISLVDKVVELILLRRR